MPLEVQPSISAGPTRHCSLPVTESIHSAIRLPGFKSWRHLFSVLEQIAWLHFSGTQFPLYKTDELVIPRHMVLLRDIWFICLKYLRSCPTHNNKSWIFTTVLIVPRGINTQISIFNTVFIHSSLTRKTVNLVGPCELVHIQNSTLLLHKTRSHFWKLNICPVN